MELPKETSVKPVNTDTDRNIEASFQKESGEGSAGYLRLKVNGSYKTYRVTVWHQGNQLEFGKKDWNKISKLALSILEKQDKIEKTEHLGAFNSIKMGQGSLRLTSKGIQSAAGQPEAYGKAKEDWEALDRLIKKLFAKQPGMIKFEEVDKSKGQERDKPVVNKKKTNKKRGNALLKKKNKKKNRLLS